MDDREHGLNVKFLLNPTSDIYNSIIHKYINKGLSYIYIYIYHYQVMEDSYYDNSLVVCSPPLYHLATIFHLKFTFDFLKIIVDYPRCPNFRVLMLSLSFRALSKICHVPVLLKTR